MDKVLGPEMGRFVRELHEEHGVIFHLDDSATAMKAGASPARAAATLEADLVITGVGVRPRLALAEKAGLAVDRGVTVNAYLETSDPDDPGGGRYRALARSAYR